MYWSYIVTLNPQSMMSALKTVVMFWQQRYKQQQLKRATKQPGNKTHGLNCTCKSIHVPQSKNYTAFNSLILCPASRFLVTFYQLFISNSKTVYKQDNCFNISKPATCPYSALMSSLFLQQTLSPKTSKW